MAYELPDKLSDLLELALDKILIVEADTENYVVDMATWVRPKMFNEYKPRCHVCSAGAVMELHLGQLKNARQACFPSDYDCPVVNAKLTILSALSFGLLCMAASRCEAADMLGSDKLTEMANEVAVPGYTEDRDGWHVALRQLVTLLRDAGV